MFQWMIVWAGFALLPPVTVFASDIAQGEVRPAGVEAEEAAHEQAEALRHRTEEDRAIAEIRAAALRDGEEAGAAIEEMAPDDGGDAEDVDQGEPLRRDATTGDAVDDAADAARHRVESSFEDPETAGEFEPAE